MKTPLEILRENNYNLRKHFTTPITELPPFLFHYTTSDGLLGILRTGKLWATNTYYVNDVSEIDYGCNIIRELVNEKLNDPSNPKHIKEFLNVLNEPSFWQRHMYLFNHNEPQKNEIFVSCFCAKGDLLSQWKGYGAQGSGFSIGFSREKLFKQQIQIFRVIYEPADQYRLVKETIDEICKILDTVITSTGITDYNNLVRSSLMEISMYFRRFSLCFKHKAFKEEQEWRIIVMYDPSMLLKEIRFRSVRGNVVPYVEVDLSEKITADLTLLPIQKVYCGPTLHPQNAKSTIQALFKSFGYVDNTGNDIVEVIPSEIPFTNT